MRALLVATLALFLSTQAIAQSASGVPKRTCQFPIVNMVGDGDPFTPGSVISIWDRQFTLTFLKMMSQAVELPPEVFTADALYAVRSPDGTYRVHVVAGGCNLGYLLNVPEQDLRPPARNFSSGGSSSTDMSSIIDEVEIDRAYDMIVEIFRNHRFGYRRPKA